ncbi:MAG: hypothetical protein A2V87_08795 [Deltaproteobacteria bacterium RBG_16_58_17]|nr:MAG: hypothetical protein A2V87_08795 [Deltaproteobacteria bacterium RBG_16_58_17]OHE16632.1 MAG: hypothetical protein A2X96_09700 [Syntrophobacterales bacterium GWC2_56_13]OHE20752.1 MAG: hypothetical protein A2X95_08180 [Syntrophobacterales bacterium GWF2_56_9]
MAENLYHALCETLAKRRGRYPGKDIPEFYALVEELFTSEELDIGHIEKLRIFTCSTAQRFYFVHSRVYEPACLSSMSKHF